MWRLERNNMWHRAIVRMFRYIFSLYGGFTLFILMGEEKHLEQSMSSTTPHTI
jgi:hypothetical protein